MHILIVDDSSVSRAFFSDLLTDAGYDHILLAESVEEAFRKIHAYGDDNVCSLIDLILMDINMPGKDGIQGCRELKELDLCKDIPVILISGIEDIENLDAAFQAGALDYLNKPPNRVELLARVRSALRLKYETDRRKARELELISLTRQLEETNRELKRISSLDGLTGIANRHAFDQFFQREWREAVREEWPVAVIMIDIDCFKAYNDTYGHLAGDECLKKVAMALQAAVHRPSDLLARYGGEEFVAVLPKTDEAGAFAVAGALHAAVGDLAIDHHSSLVCEYVTVSAGVASTIPLPGSVNEQLLVLADNALYQAKQEGRNRTKLAAPLPQQGE